MVSLEFGPELRVLGVIEGGDGGISLEDWDGDQIPEIVLGDQIFANNFTSLAAGMRMGTIKKYGYFGYEDGGDVGAAFPAATGAGMNSSRSWRGRRSAKSGDAARPKFVPHHHHVYVVLLDEAVWRERRVRAANPKRDPMKPCVYVGMTGLPPIERFWNHKDGYKASYYVCKYGERLVPELFAYLNPMPYDAAVQMEKDLAEDLRAQGYGVCGGT